MSLLLLFNQATGPANYKLTCLAGQYNQTGQQATISRNRSLTAQSGSYAVAGQQATITKASAGAYTLTCLSGSYVVSGQNATINLPATTKPLVNDKGGGWHGKKDEYYDHSQDIWAYEKTVKKQTAVIKSKITKLKKQVKVVDDGAETAAEARQRVQIERRIYELQQQQNNLSEMLAQAWQDYQNQQWLNDQLAQEQLAKEIYQAEQEAIRQEALRQEELRRIEEEDIVYVMTVLSSL